MASHLGDIALYDALPVAMRDILKTVPIDPDNLEALFTLYQQQGRKVAMRALLDWLKAEGIDWAGKSL